MDTSEKRRTIDRLEEAGSGSAATTEDNKDSTATLRGFGVKVRVSFSNTRDYLILIVEWRPFASLPLISVASAKGCPTLVLPTESRLFLVYNRIEYSTGPIYTKEYPRTI